MEGRKTGKMIKRTGIGTLLLLVLCLCACNVKSTKSLIREAKATYGPVKVISQSSGQDYSEVVLMDKTQGFEYTMSSGLMNVGMDGSSFGDWEHTSTDFHERFAEYVCNDAKMELDSLCGQYNATWEHVSREAFIMVQVSDPSDAKPLTEAIAGKLQPYNERKRLDLSAVWAKDSNENHLGSTPITTGIFRGPEEEKADEMLDVAKNFDSKSTYVKMEKKTLKDLGVNVNEVTASKAYSYYDEYPDEDHFQVKVYYFLDGNGRQFFICDFFVATERSDLEPYNNFY